MKKGFTLIELLVVVLIIGILAAIAIPQYKKAIYKARVHVGVSLAASLYQAEQSYYLVHGVFATDIDALDIEVPKNEGCEKWEETGATGYECKDWQIDIENSTRSINFSFPRPGPQIGYMYVFNDIPSNKLPEGKYKAGSRYCYAKEATKPICENLGGTFLYASSLWSTYELK